MQYRTIDWYEGREVLYKGEDLAAARRARKERYDETDDEADVTIEECVIGEDGKPRWQQRTNW